MKFLPPSFLFFLAFIILSTGQANAQKEVNYEVGQLLIQPIIGADIHSIVEDLQEVNQKRTQLTVEKLVSKHIRTWLVTFDHNTISHRDMINAAYSHYQVEIVQNNHKVTMRNVPNDIGFPQQWQYINTGQSGGTPGADIDIDSAWDITTGGLTAQGDTIVVAVLDDGIDLNHQDFGNNRWRNYGEIPNNNIDDDGNGYVDDYEGWSIVTNSDNISGGSHGTPVAGIVGAKGDNNIGVSGISWNVKVMVIKNDFNTNEGAVLSAYSYPLEMRKRYNSSGGTQGAFVVSTNASWGVNFGQPANAPLWCAFYDTLGVHGILNCGATANLNINVDTQGDLPTACPSDYLISVTNMNHNDNKVTSAGYGATTIDIGAFGENTYTTAQGGGYAGFGGTSGATPHVAGTIGLLYAAPCPSFAALAKSNPGQASLLIKQYIYDGADANTSLNGITSTGGRLNVWGAMQEMLNDFCDSSGCFQPFSLHTSNLIDTSVTLHWQALADSSPTYIIRYKKAIDTSWVSFTDTTTSTSLTGLAACTDYQFQVAVVCDSSQTSSFSVVFPFKTIGCCDPPANITASNITDTTVTITWDSVFVANSYILKYKLTSDTTWILDTTTTATVSLTNLVPCSPYDIEIQTLCDSSSTMFTASTFTSGCGPCTTLPYCSTSGDTQFEFIDAVVLNTINNTSGDNNGYGDFTSFSTDLVMGQQYTITLTPGFQGQPYTEHFRVWIDYNQDGDFNDSNELVFAPGGSNGSVSGSLTVPATAVVGGTRMRVAMNYNNPVGNPCSGNLDGEAEDYCINIIFAALTCDAPINVDTLSLTPTTAMISWVDTSSGASNFDIRYRELGTMAWTSTTAASTSATLSGLQDCTTYEFEVSTICSNGLTSNYSAPFTFSTPCISCLPPTNLDTIAVDTLAASLNFTAADFAASYQVRYKEDQQTNWTVISISSPYIALNGLIECGKYTLQARTICVNGDTSAYSDAFIFRTSCSVNTLELPTSIDKLQLYPNPVSQVLTLDMTFEVATELTLQVYAISGQEVYSQLLTAQSGNQIIKIPTTTWGGSGTYILQLTTDDGVVHRKVMKL